MKPIEVFKHYYSLKMYFEKNFYVYKLGKDFIPVKGASIAAYNKRPDIYHFEKMADKYTDETIIDVLIGNLSINPKLHITKFFSDDAMKNGMGYRREKKSAEYSFRVDMNNICDIIRFEFDRSIFDMLTIFKNDQPLIYHEFRENMMNRSTLLTLNEMFGLENRDGFDDPPKSIDFGWGRKYFPLLNFKLNTAVKILSEIAEK